MMRLKSNKNLFAVGAVTLLLSAGCASTTIVGSTTRGTPVVITFETSSVVLAKEGGWTCVAYGNNPSAQVQQISLRCDDRQTGVLSIQRDTTFGTAELQFNLSGGERGSGFYSALGGNSTAEAAANAATIQSVIQRSSASTNSASTTGQSSGGQRSLTRPRQCRSPEIECSANDAQCIAEYGRLPLCQ